MEETTFANSPREAESSRPSSLAGSRQSHAGGQRSPLGRVAKRPSAQRAALPISRSLILSLLVFVLSFAVLLAGPALVLRLMAASAGATGDDVAPVVAGAPVPDAAALDTTVTLQQGNLPTAGYAGTTDAFINRWRPTVTSGSDGRVSIGQDGAYRALIRFDLAPAGIPGGATITSAQLGLYAYDRNMAGSVEIGVYQVVRSWTEADATWQMATASASAASVGFGFSAR